MAVMHRRAGARRGPRLARRQLGPGDHARRVVGAAAPSPAGPCPPGPSEWFGKGLPRELAAHGDRGASGGRRDRAARRASACCSPARRSSPTAPTTQKERYLRPIVNGQEAWCQLFSEPGAGSDLASPAVPCRARRRRVDRQRAEGVDVGRRRPPTSACSLARTDPDAPKHKGISYFAYRDGPARRRGAAAARDDGPGAVQRGVLRRRARRRLGDCIGGLGRRLGRRQHDARERARRARRAAAAARSAAGSPGKKARHARPAGSASSWRRAAGTAPSSRHGRTRSALLDEAARKDSGATQDPVHPPAARAGVHPRTRSAGSCRCGRSGCRRRAAAARAEGNLAKLLMSRMLRLGRDLGPEIIGPYGMLVGADTPGDGNFQEATRLCAPAAVDLRRQRRDPEEHRRRARARAAQGAGRRPRQEHAVPRAQGRDATRRELTARRE